MDVQRRLRRIDAFQQRRRWLAVPLAVFKKFGDDHGGHLAAVVAYYAFFSMFPLLLVFVTILGFVLQGSPGEQQSVEHSVTSQFPGIGHSLHLSALHGHTLVLVFGIVTSLLSGLGVTQAAQSAFDTIWAVPMKHRRNFVHSRVRGLALLVSLGILFLVATLASGLVTGGLGGPLLTVVGIVFSLVLNFLLFLAAFRWMTSGTIPTRCLLIGVTVAAACWEVLQIFGGIYIGHVEKHWSGTYASLGFVIALLVWLHLGSQMTLYAAEINVVVGRKLWPRSVFGPPEEPADERTLEALAKVEERHDTEQVDVSFERGRRSPGPAH
jgi:YihY family inner membrane protein